MAPKFKKPKNRGNEVIDLRSTALSRTATSHLTIQPSSQISCRAENWRSTKNPRQPRNDKTTHPLTLVSLPATHFSLYVAMQLLSPVSQVRSLLAVLDGRLRAARPGRSAAARTLIAAPSFRHPRRTFYAIHDGVRKFLPA
jgi:hypothetical protein